MNWQNKSLVPQESSFQMSALFRGLLVSLGISLILILLMSLVVQYSGFRENNLSTAGIFIVILSTLFGGFYTGKNAGTRGLWHGLGVGLAFAGIALLVSAFMYSDSLSWLGFFKKCLWSSIGGILGGIFGVGSK